MPWYHRLSVDMDILFEMPFTGNIILCKDILTKVPIKVCVYKKMAFKSIKYIFDF